MTKITNEEIKKLSIEELKASLTKAKNQKGEIGIKLRSQQSHDINTYKNNKLLIAQINTELRSRELHNQSN